MKTYKNEHLSFSRISRFEQCPASFGYHYVDGARARPGPPLVFGKLIHGVLELAVKYDYTAEGALSAYKQGWTESGLTSAEMYGEGADLVASFYERSMPREEGSVLSVEQEFLFSVGRFRVIGYMDRVDRVNGDTVEIVDYKTNRMIYTRDEVDNSLQMSIYAIAARELALGKERDLDF